MRQRRRSEMPSDEEIAQTQLWTIGHLIEKRREAVKFQFVMDNPAEPLECELHEVVYDPNKDYLTIQVRPAGGESPAMASEPVEGTPSSD